MTDLIISWDRYHHTIEQLANNIQASDWEFNQIFCLAKGGLRVGDILARIFDCPLAVFNVASYGGSDDRHRGTLKRAENFTNFGILGDRLLLVDDLVDSGITLQTVKQWLQEEYPHLLEVRTAVLWAKGSSGIKPDYYVEYLADNPWIQQPFEHYQTFFPDEV